MLIDHLVNVQNETNTFGAAHSAALFSPSKYGRVKGISADKDR